MAHTVIGKGSPNKAGTNKAHGAPLGREEIKNAKVALGIPLKNFMSLRLSIIFFMAKWRAMRLKSEMEADIRGMVWENPRYVERI